VSQHKGHSKPLCSYSSNHPLLFHSIHTHHQQHQDQPSRHQH
jgi:hypothetical protein